MQNRLLVTPGAQPNYSVANYGNPTAVSRAAPGQFLAVAPAVQYVAQPVQCAAQPVQYAAQAGQYVAQAGRPMQPMGAQQRVQVGRATPAWRKDDSDGCCNNGDWHDCWDPLNGCVRCAVILPEHFQQSLDFLSDRCK